MKFRHLLVGDRFAIGPDIYVKCNDRQASNIKNGHLEMFQSNCIVNYIQWDVPITGKVMTFGWKHGTLIKMAGVHVMTLTESGAIDIHLEIKA